MVRDDSRTGTRDKLLDAAVALVRAQGYAGTSVEDLCLRAGVSKGAFFYHFKTKEDLAVAAAAHFSAFANEVFAQAPYRELSDPLDRLLAYVNFRKEMLQGEISEFTCLLGAMVQEAYATHPEIQKACELHLGNHVSELKLEIFEAARLHSVKDMEAIENLAVFIQATGDATVAAACLSQLYRHIQLVFNAPSGAIDPLAEKI
jgi:TetR/AcrR family transcriptional regulator, transcriptional repressor for nem operon